MELENCCHPACLDLDSLVRECEFSRTRSGGPGGQHRNKVETMVVVTHKSAGVSAQASERRSQHENKKVALERLREALAIQVRISQRPLQPSDLWRERCRAGRISCSSKHHDFACLLAEALDFLAVFDFQTAAAANKLQCTTSQLIKFIKLSEKAFAWVNQQRKNRDLGPLK